MEQAFSLFVLRVFLLAFARPTRVVRPCSPVCSTTPTDGKTVGRHYAGPNWEHTDGSAVVGKVVANAPGKTTGDIAWLKLDVTARRGGGTLAGISTVQRINTQGGLHAGACEKASAFYSVAYAADYVFLRKRP